MKRLKIINTSKLGSTLYSVEFNDGILLNIRYRDGAIAGKVEHMCSLGPDSYFVQQGYFPKGQNLRKRLTIGTDMIKVRMKRYKKKFGSESD